LIVSSTFSSANTKLPWGLHVSKTRFW
jgi:hypothetical protein